VFADGRSRIVIKVSAAIRRVINLILENAEPVVFLKLNEDKLELVYFLITVINSQEAEARIVIVNR
jgi:hypothetical protein